MVLLQKKIFAVTEKKEMKRNDAYKNIALCVGLILLLSMLSTILFSNVSDGDALMQLNYVVIS